MELTNTNNINTYKEIIEIRTFLKGVQQLSWDINSLEKRYPIDRVSEEDLATVLDIYRGLKDRLIDLQLKANGGEPF